MTTATQRTLALLRVQGYRPWIVEKFNSFSGKRSDLFNIIDILILTPDNVIGIQSAGVNFSGHKNKLMIEEEYNTRHWLRTKGNELILIGWRKVKFKRMGKRRVYRPRIAVITLKNKNLHFEEVKYQWLRTRKKVR